MDMGAIRNDKYLGYYRIDSKFKKPTMCTGAVAVATAASTCELPSQVKTIMYAASEASLSFNDEGH